MNGGALFADSICRIPPHYIKFRYTREEYIILE
jgi:hypothetical protein